MVEKIKYINFFSLNWILKKYFQQLLHSNRERAHIEKEQKYYKLKVKLKVKYLACEKFF